MEPRELRAWLMAKPKPALLIVANEEGEQRIELPPEGVRWVQVANTVWALQPDVIQALDAKGALIRAVRPNEEEEVDPSAPNVSLSQDPEQARLICFAQLISEAYKDSREFTAMAFDKLGELFQAVVAKANSQEKTISALDRMVQKLVLEKVAAGGGGGEDDPLTLDSLMRGMIQGKLQAEAEQVVNGTHTAPAAPAAPPKEGKKK